MKRLLACLLFAFLGGVALFGSFVFPWATFKDPNRYEPVELTEIHFERMRKAAIPERVLTRLAPFKAIPLPVSEFSKTVIEILNEEMLTSRLFPVMDACVPRRCVKRWGRASGRDFAFDWRGTDMNTAFQGQIYADKEKSVKLVGFPGEPLFSDESLNEAEAKLKKGEYRLERRTTITLPRIDPTVQMVLHLSLSLILLNCLILFAVFRVGRLACYSSLLAILLTAWPWFAAFDFVRHDSELNDFGVDMHLRFGWGAWLSLICSLAMIGVLAYYRFLGKPVLPTNWGSESPLRPSDAILDRSRRDRGLLH